MKKYKILFFCLVVVSSLFSQRPDPLLVSNADKQQKWVDSIFKTLTIDEKIGQLFMVQAYSNKDANHQKYVEELITKHKIGNLIFMQGTPLKQAELTNQYQSLSKIPMLIGFDGEWGLDMRLQNTYKFPWNMTLGAIQDNTLIEQFGKQLGEHCKRLGIHVNFAPVVDINTNPKNPIIGNRSFGEDKLNVTQKAISFVKGMQSVGVLANAKHFPGHGDTSTDSHHTLPVLDFTKSRIDTLELYPYKKLFDTKLTSVMTAHLSIPALESNKALPTSLSKNVVTDLLQNNLGFRGLIFTDGLNMKGAANYATSSEINLAALQAGNDVLLIPQDIEASIRYIKQALTLKVLSEERLNASVIKILKAKYWAGLHQYKPIDLYNLEADLNKVEDELLHRKLVESSITVLKNKDNLLPISNLENKKIAYVKLGDDTNADFISMLQHYTKVDVIDAVNLDELIKKLKKYNLVVVGYHKSNQNPWKDFKFTDKEIVWLQEIARTNKVIVDVFASPYSLAQVKSFTNIEAVIVSYQNSKIAQEISAQLLFGAFNASGKLPVSIADHFSVNVGLETYKLSRLSYGLPEEVQMSSRLLARIDVAAQEVITKKMAPGLQILVARHGKVVYQKSFGHHTYDNVQPVKNTDVYDLASLTKILASLPVLMKAEEEEKISLTASLQDILPAFKNSNKASISVKEILSHFGRLQPWVPFYKKTQDKGINKSELYSPKKNSKFDLKVADNLYLDHDYRDSIIENIKNLNQRETLGYKYSDLGYYLFQKALEDTYQKPLNELVDEEFYQSLGANRATYNPLDKFSKAEIVPTEIDDYYRNQLLHGYVHDMGAAMLGGVAGHAGLFANANDVAKIMQMYLQKGFYGGKRYLKAETVNKFNTRYYAQFNVRRGLGFDKPQLDSGTSVTCGCVSDESFGHSGFTGTYTWADPKSGIVYVFLSNRVYPNMNNRALIDSNIRTKIQQIIQDAILN